MSAASAYVIVGAGLAGATAAQTLREEGSEGQITLVGAEAHRPYQRPPLSKGYAQGESPLEALFVHPESFYADHDITLLLKASAQSLDPARHELHLADGSVLRYDRLLLATGAEPRRPDIPGSHLEGVLYLRTVEDASRLRDLIDQGGRLVVVGAGWIGTEVASSARQRGMEVTVIDPAEVPLQRTLGSEVGGIYRDLHAANGVRMELGTVARAFEGATSVTHVLTAGGRRIGCDAVLVGVGAQPRTRLAADAGLKVANGVLVDAQLQSSAPDVFAAGDVALAHHPLYGEPVRVEHWANAERQGALAARNMLGAGESYDELPYFYSDQFDLGMEYSGLARDWDQVILRGDPQSGQFIAFWLERSRVAAAMNANIWDRTDELRSLIRTQAPVDPRALADPSVPLRELAASGQRPSS